VLTAASSRCISVGEPSSAEVTAVRPCPALCSLLLGAAIAGAPGCSFVLVHGPPAGHERLAAFSCTRSDVLPILDAIAAGTGLFVGATLLGANTRDAGAWAAPYVVVGAGFALEGLLFGTSAVSGFVKTGHCRAALREQGARAAGAGRDPAQRAAPPGP
jgi:hypothetical protein